MAHRQKHLLQLRNLRNLLTVPQKILTKNTAVTDNVLVYKTSLKVEQVMKALEEIRTEKI